MDLNERYSIEKKSIKCHLYYVIQVAATQEKCVRAEEEKKAIRRFHFFTDPFLNQLIEDELLTTKKKKKKK